jgi:hypothetical protein
MRGWRNNPYSDLDRKHHLRLLLGQLCTVREKSLDEHNLPQFDPPLPSTNIVGAGNQTELDTPQLKLEKRSQAQQQQPTDGNVLEKLACSLSFGRNIQKETFLAKFNLSH